MKDDPAPVAANPSAKEAELNKAPIRRKRGRVASAYEQYMIKAKADLAKMQAKIDAKPKMKREERRKIENNMSALRTRMRKREQGQREQLKVAEIANIIEDVLSQEATGKKYGKKIKDRVDRALKQMKQDVGDSLAESISLYY